MPVQAAAGPVVPDRGPRVGMGGSFPDVAQRHPGVQRGGDERVPQRVRGDRLADPGVARGLADDPPGAVPVQPPSVGGQEDGSLWASRAEWPFPAPCRWLLFLGCTGSLATPWRGRGGRLARDGNFADSPLTVPTSAAILPAQNLDRATTLGDGRFVR
jgi:hypothetical protein